MIKNGILVALSIVLVASCGDSKENDKTAEPVAKVYSAEYEEGLQLVAKSDCFTCHKISEAFTGPSYESIAAKYADNPENVSLLAGKVINGGVGVWGQVPMNAHPTLSDTVAKKMIKYILLLKK